ncbi:TlpA family protein disulfide reductase [Paenibacillus sp. N3/727]|uniref:TlpA family protein disulfide reductase n=1 Tax=Paenibacillus sp. N3/727 TaxID=2925845 RepID=UPI001F530560|nr:TlpA family protein disulfide reductase [Paenibacillus sp. N3/727]UNK18687.1 TlpA family protein disulfide reductase [Paenibacillus sp. N3/727]
MKKIRVIGTSLILLAFIISIIFVVVSYTSSKGLPPPERVTLENVMDSQQVTIDFTERPTVFIFFTSWCPSCIEDAPKIMSMHEKYKDQVNIYGINVTNRDEKREVKKYVYKYAIKYPVLLDKEGDLYAQYGGKGLPSLYFLDGQGKIVKEIIGSSDIDIIEQSFVNLIGVYD